MFPRFNELPTEIRLLIWGFLPGRSRIFVIDKPEPSRDNLDFVVKSVSRYPHAHACREARHVDAHRDRRAMGAWKSPLQNQSKYKNGCCSPVWACFEPSRDEIYLTSRALQNSILLDLGFLDRYYGEIRTLMIPQRMKYKFITLGTLLGLYCRGREVDSISVVERRLALGPTAWSRLAEYDLPRMVSIEEPCHAKMIEDLLHDQPRLLAEWNDIFTQYRGVKTIGEHEDTGLNHHDLCKDWKSVILLTME